VGFSTLLTTRLLKIVAELLGAGAANDTGRCEVLPLDLALRAHNHGVAHELLLVRE
jgi:hypothetical protein